MLWRSFVGVALRPRLEEVDDDVGGGVDAAARGMHSESRTGRLARCYNRPWTILSNSVASHFVSIKCVATASGTAKVKNKNRTAVKSKQPLTQHRQTLWPFKPVALKVSPGSKCAFPEEGRQI